MPTPPQRPPNSTAPPPAASDAPSVPALGPTLPYARPSPAAGAPALQVPGYEIQGELGRGGMGVVYLAKNVLMNRLEVLKVANRALLDRQPGAAERFLREIRAAAQLGHENVVKAYSAVQVGELLVFAMEYVEGEDLDKVVKRQGPLPVPHACHYVSHAALGLQHAHEQGMVHRDIKPPNLILTRRGKKHVVKVLDFGLAKAVREGEAATDLTGAGAMMGTPAYMAPETAQDAATADIRADIYSLGCTLYFLLTGAPPFAGASIYAILKAHESTEASPLHQKRAGIPAELSAVAARMMAKNPARRYQKPIDAAKALAPFIKPGTLPPPEPIQPPPLAKILTEWPPTATAVDKTEAPKPREQSPPAPSVFNLPTVIGRGARPTAATKKPAAGPTRPATKKGANTWSIAAAIGLLLWLLAGVALWVSGAFGVGPSPLDCTKDKGVSAADVQKAQEAWAHYLGRQVEEEDEIAPGVKMKFVLIPPGRFQMGSPTGEAERSTDEVQHEVKLTHPFYLGVYDVTQGQYEAVTGKTPSTFKGADLPVETVSWEEADAFAKGLTEKARDGLLYRLPTEAEWEYSCRGGRSSSLPFGIGDGTSLSSHDADFDGNYPYSGADKGPYLEKTTPVGTYQANALGLYDMHGNVYQWCSDWYGEYPTGTVTNPSGPSSGPSRVIRGGSWCFYAWSCRAAHRFRFEPGHRYDYLGVRLARVPSGLDK